MGGPPSLDLRERVVAGRAGGMSGRQAAKHFSIGASTALRWARRLQHIGSPKAKPMGGKRPFALAAHRAWIMARLIAKPDLTLRALLAEVRARGARVSSFAVWSIMADADLSFKKACGPASRTARTSRAGGANGSSTRTRLIPSAWSSSTRPG